MKPTKQLVDGLRKAADRIEKGREGGYRWSQPGSCNCGVLLQELQGLVESAVLHQHNLLCDCKHNTWTEIDQIFEKLACGTMPFSGTCSATGLSVQELALRLKEYGLEEGDFELLEFCGTTEAEHIDGLGIYRDCRDSYGNPEYVAKFFRNLADELESKLPVEHEQEQEQHVEVRK